MATKRRRAVYTGDLATPLRPIPYHTTVAALLQGEAESAAMLAQRQERERRFWLLFDHYGIADRSNFAALAARLAMDHVPGLRETEPPGRKMKWTSANRAQLLMAVGTVMPPARNKMHAARILIKKTPWSELGIKASALRRLMDPDTRTIWLEPAPAQAPTTLRDLLSKYVLEGTEPS